MWMKINVPVYYEVFGIVEYDVPDDLKNRDEIEDHLSENIDDIPLPEDTSYIDGSFEINWDMLDYYNKGVIRNEARGRKED